MESTAAIMQPYFFPYIGYFQLISAADVFVFYDDVNYITQGWINRNRILINGSPSYFTIPCREASQNKLICEVEHALTPKKTNKLLRKIRFAYANAPQFETIFPVVESVFEKSSGADTISELAIESVVQSMNYIGIDTKTRLSSERYSNRSLGKADRLIDICKKEGAGRYINAIGGQDLYDKSYFKKQGIELEFLEPQLTKYGQNQNQFVPWLSIVDVMMFNEPSQIRDQFLNNYNLI